MDFVKHTGSNFLSCLFGSEPAVTRFLWFIEFLSCLFGSERVFNAGVGIGEFLSCLFGSERLQKT